MPHNDNMKTVVLVHGRHLETKEWESLVWGKEENKRQLSGRAFAPASAA